MMPHDIKRAALIADEAVLSYPPPPYSPPEFLPEYVWRHNEKFPLAPVASTGVYGMVRQAFLLLGLDRKHFGTASWDPLSDIITLGDTVLIKPNLVFDSNHSGYGPDCLVTHGSVVRAVADYAALAMKNKGRLLLGDAPIQACSFEAALSASGIDEVIRFFDSQGICIEVQDFRNRAAQERPLGLLNKLTDRTHSNDGCVEVAVDGMSALSPLDGHVSKYRVTCYDPDVMRRHHGVGVHKYLIAKSVLASDAVISIAKMKTHRKGG